MKFLFFVPLIAIWQLCSISNASEESLEKVSLQIEADVTIEFSAKEIIAVTRSSSPGLSIYLGQLWQPAMTNPPEKIMISGAITIDGEKVELDVSGLATLWIHPSEMAKDDCRFEKHEFGENDHYHTLDVCFFKGGALDYVVRWIIYKNKSMRESIINVGDKYPDWYKKQ